MKNDSRGHCTRGRTVSAGTTALTGMATMEFTPRSSPAVAALSRVPDPNAPSGLTLGLYTVGAVIGLVLIGRFLLNPAFRLIGRLSERELFVVAGLFTVIAASALALISRWTLTLRLDTDPRFSAQAAKEAFSGAEFFELRVWQSMFDGCGAGVLKLFMGVRGVKGY